VSALQGPSQSVDDGFSPMPWTRSCEWYSSNRIGKDLGPMQAHDKSKVRDSCRECCGFLAEVLLGYRPAFRVPHQRDFGASTNQVRSGSWNKCRVWAWPGVVGDWRIGVRASLSIWSRCTLLIPELTLITIKNQNQNRTDLNICTR